MTGGERPVAWASGTATNASSRWRREVTPRRCRKTNLLLAELDGS
jgi:hypothetical protein